MSLASRYRCWHCRGEHVIHCSISSVHLRAAVGELGDTGFFTRRVGLETVCVARQLATYPIQALAWDVSDRRPLGVSNAGIAILAGMETDEARDLLASCGCDYGQGFLMARPMPADDVVALALANRAAARTRRRVTSAPAR